MCKSSLFIRVSRFSLQGVRSVAWSWVVSARLVLVSDITLAWGDGKGKTDWGTLLSLTPFERFTLASTLKVWSVSASPFQLRGNLKSLLRSLFSYHRLLIDSANVPNGTPFTLPCTTFDQGPQGNRVPLGSEKLWPNKKLINNAEDIKGQSC
jgi:hypothetical protein